MPSDLPPNEPQQPGSSGTAGTEGRSDAGQRAGGASADVRRYADSGGGAPKRSSAISNSFALAMIVAFVVVAVVMFQQGPSLMQSPRVLPGAPAVVPTAPAASDVTAPAATAAARPTFDPNSPLARAYGVSALNSASRQARRIGQAVAVAAACGVRTAYWANEVREVVATQESARYPAFEEDGRTKEMLKRFIAQEFIAGQRSTDGVFAERGKQAACDDIRYSPDFRAAVNASEQAGIR